MGNSLSSSPLIPLTFAEYFREGRIDINKYQLYLLVKRKRETSLQEPIHLIQNTEVNVDDNHTKKKRKRSVKKHRIQVYNIDGSWTYMEPCNSLWYLLYISREPRSKKDKNLFRKRFCLSYNSFKKLLNEVKQHELFSRWLNKDAAGDSAVPIDLLLLGFLRYVGRGFTLDDLEECTAIDAETHRQFIKIFIRYGSSTLWNKFVIKTKNDEDAQYNTKLFNSAGFPGCIGSVDGTHVVLECCADWSQNKHKGYKLNKPSRNYNVTCNHMREFIGCTRGFPATWNNKTTVLYDDFTRGIYTGAILPNYEFELKEYDPEGNIVSIQYQGVWLICDNGYLNWSTTVPPFKETNSFGHLIFSKWIESMRKDIECAFGILKGCFRILKYGMRFQKVDECDMLFKSLCALHNYLIKEDGLDTNWLGYEEAYREDQMSRNLFPPMLLRCHSLYVEQSNSSQSQPYT